MEITKRNLRLDETTLLEPVQYCLYARKSTEQEEKQALSIESQVKEMSTLARREGLIIKEIRRESHSAKATGQRAVFNELLKDIREQKFNGILTWAPDRLSRNAGDLGALVDLFDQNILKEIRTFSQRFTNTPNEKFLLMILGAQGKLENDQKGLNVERGLRARCEMGLWPAPAPTGYLNHPDRTKKCHVIVDVQRAPVIKQVFEKVADEGWGGRKIYRWLKEIKFLTKSGKPLTLSNVYTILNNHFYHGTFEYPKESGQWFQGKHIPLISRELFDRVQNQLKLQSRLHGKNKEFAFTKMFTCGACGSGVTAQEKYKNLKDESIAKYIYYGCTRARNINCKEGCIEEKVLINQLTEIVDKINLDKSGLKKKLETEIERHKKFHSKIMGKKDEKYLAKDADIRNYAKYLLSEGSIFEKRDLLMCFKSKINLKEKLLSLSDFP